MKLKVNFKIFMFRWLLPIRLSLIGQVSWICTHSIISLKKIFAWCILIVQFYCRLNAWKNFHFSYGANSQYYHKTKRQPSHHIISIYLSSTATDVMSIFHFYIKIAEKWQSIRIKQTESRLIVLQIGCYIYWCICIVSAINHLSSWVDGVAKSLHIRNYKKNIPQ